MRKTYKIRFDNHVLHLTREQKSDALLMMFINLEFVQTCMHLCQMIRMRISNYVFIMNVYDSSNTIRIEYWQIKS